MSFENKNNNNSDDINLKYRLNILSRDIEYWFDNNKKGKSIIEREYEFISLIYDTILEGIKNSLINGNENYYYKMLIKKEIQCGSFIDRNIKYDRFDSNIQLFGSCVYGLSLRESSDIDIQINIANDDILSELIIDTSPKYYLNNIYKQFRKIAKKRKISVNIVFLYFYIVLCVILELYIYTYKYNIVFLY